MSIDVHTISLLPGGSDLAQSDRMLLWQSYGIANGAGGSAGASVAVAVNLGAAAGSLPGSAYFVEVELDQDATYCITGKSASGFTVNLQPRLASETLAAGSFNVRVTA